MHAAADFSSYTRKSSGEGRLLALGLACGEAWMVPLTCAGLGGPPAQDASTTAMPSAAPLRAKILTLYVLPSCAGQHSHGHAVHRVT